MNSSLAYEIGAVFLFAAMLMFGTAHSVIPKSVRNIGAPVFVSVALAGFLIWRFGPDLYANMRSNAAPWFPAAEPIPAETASPAPTAVPDKSKPFAPKANVSGQVNPNRNGVVIHDFAPASPDVALPAVQAVVETLPAEKPAGTRGKEPEEKFRTDDSAGSPYDSGVKRAVKSVGHFLHIGRKKEPPSQ
jgi:hypothetical protein